MAMTRMQLKKQAAIARYEANKHKPATRKQIQMWLDPIRSAVKEMMTGEMNAVQGYAVTRIKWCGNDHARVDHVMNGFIGLLNRLTPDLNIEALCKVSRKLNAGVLLEQHNLTACVTLLNEVEDRLMEFTRQQLSDTATTEMINIEFERLGLK